MYTPFVYPGSTNANSVYQYVALANTARDRWYQAGRVQRQQFKYHYFEWVDGAGILHGNYDSVPVPADGTSERWDVLYGICGATCFSFQINGQDRHYVSGLGWTPTIGEFWGEIQSSASQMPGGYNNAANWFYTKLRLYGTWASFDGTLYWIPSWTTGWFGAIKWSAQTYSIWDKYCQV